VVADVNTLSHTTWVCTYHVVCIPKYRRQALYRELRRHLGDVFRALATQRECRVEEGHLMPDHVHMLLSVPSKYAVAQVIGFIEETSAIHIARTSMGRKRNFTGQHFGARGYYVSTVGRDEATIRADIQKGCDRSIPKDLCCLSPIMNTFAHVLLVDGHRF
jgi:putative transposase